VKKSFLLIAGNGSRQEQRFVSGTGQNIFGAKSGANIL
jgi:hypothetical protein